MRRYIARHLRLVGGVILDTRLQHHSISCIELDIVYESNQEYLFCAHFRVVILTGSRPFVVEFLRLCCGSLLKLPDETSYSEHMAVYFLSFFCLVYLSGTVESSPLIIVDQSSAKNRNLCYASITLRLEPFFPNLNSSAMHTRFFCARSRLGHI